MKKIFTLLFVLCSFLAFSQSTTVVISQVYGGGGAATGTPTYKYDYIELHNLSTSAQAIGGFSLQYGSATGNFASTATNLYAIPAGTSIPAGGYLLVQLGAAGAVGADLPVAADLVTPNLTVSATGGKVALVNNSTALGCGATATACTLPGTLIVDLVAFGTSNNAEGGAAVPALSTTTGAVRKTAGCTETNNNLNDFDVITAPVPRNAATAVNICGGSNPTTPALTVTGSIAGFGNVTVGASSASQTFNLSGTNLTGFPGVITITAPSADFEVSTNNTTFSASVTVPYTSATLASTPVYVRFSPQSAGLKAGNITIAGGGQTPALTVALNGTGVAASVPTLSTTGTINDFGNVVILTNSSSQTLNLSGTNLTGAPGNITVTAPSTDFQVSTNNTTFTASVTIPYTSATLANTPVYIRFTPQTVGVKTGNVTISGGGVATAVTIAVSGTGVNAAPPSGAQVRISQAYGGGGNASATYNQDFVELYNSGTTAVDISGWSVQYASFSGPSGTGDWSGAVLPAGSSIGAGKYFLVSFAAVGTVGANLPAADFVGPITTNLSGTAGKVALVNNSTILNGTTACSNAAVVDVLGFSTTANVATCAEGTSFTTTGIDNTKSMYRKNNGCTDTDNNSADFELGTVLARNSATAANSCGVAPTNPALTTAGTVNDFGNVVILTNSASQSFTVSGTNLTGAPGNITVTAPSTDFQVSTNNTTFAASVTIPYTSATLAATPVYVRFTPQTVGVKTGNVTISGGGVATAVTVAVSGTGVNAAPPSGSQVRISQVYGGGGNASATYNQDFVEIYNSGTTAVDVSGWSIQYASFSGPSGTGDWSGAILPAGSSIGAGKYFLVSFAAVGTVGANLPTADFVGPITTNLSGTAGKVALVNNSTILNGTTACSNAAVVDVFGFSTTANVATCAEGTSFTTTGIDNTKSMYRKNNGCTDTDNNLADFELLTVLARNSATAANVCSVAPVNPALTTAGTVNDFGSVVVLTNSASQSFTVSGTNLTGFPGVITITAPSTDFQVSNDNTTFAASTTIPYTSATLAATPVYVRFTPQTQGVKTGNVTISGGGVATALTIAVSGNGISATAPAVTATALTAFGNICTGTTSITNSFTINGSNLTTANITVAALAGYSYSTSATGPFTPTLSLTQPGGTYSQQIFVQLTATAVQSYNGNIVIDGGGLAASVNVPATGAGVNTTPTVTTGATTTVTATSAVATGSISANGCTAVTAYGIEYSTTNNFPAGTGTKVVSTDLASGVFTSTLTPLTGATVYYYRAYATNGGGTAYGAQMTFTTVAPPPAVLVAGQLAAFGTVCLPASAGPNSFTLGGANLSTANVVIGPLTGYSFATTATGTFTPSLSIAQPGGTFSQTIYVKFTPIAAQAYNGNIPVSGGGVSTPINVAVSGTGAGTPPAVTTVAASAITTSSVLLNGTITNIGCSAITAYGFEYSSINGFANGQGTSFFAGNLTGGNFSRNITGLVPGTVYYYKAFAQNNNGKTYGAQLSFKVNELGSGLIVYSTPVQKGGKLSFSLNPIKPGHYAAALYNMAGQKVFKKEMLVQIGFINDSFIIPGFIPSGVYIFQIENYEYQIRKQIIIK